MKKIASLLMMYSMLFMSYTGIMLFIAPEGKVAYWVNWTMFGMSKKEFGNMHVAFMVLFILITLLHVFYNWKLLISYLKEKSKGFIFFTKENIISLILVLFFAIGTIFVNEPFKSLFELEKNVKHYWADTLGSPPYGHAELSSLKKFCKRTDYDLKLAIKALEKNGITVKNEKDNLLKIALYNNIIPAKIYDVIFDELE